MGVSQKVCAPAKFQFGGESPLMMRTTCGGTPTAQTRPVTLLFVKFQFVGLRRSRLGPRIYEGAGKNL